MPAALQAFITSGYNHGGQAAIDMLNARNHIKQAGVYIAATNWAAAATEMTGASDDMGYFVRNLLQDDVFHQGLRRNWKDAFEWINDNWPSGATIDMDAILNAMLKAEFDELQKFIGFVDAYRIAIWNAPFNQDFYAALARGFQQWPEP